MRNSSKDAWTDSQTAAPIAAQTTGAKIEAILRAVAGDQLVPARNAVKTIVAKGDVRFAAVLIELMRASQLRILHADGRSAYLRVLETITAKLLGDDWGAWQISEDAPVGPGGERAARFGGHVAYWFGWNAFQPQTQLYAGR